MQQATTYLAIRSVLVIGNVSEAFYNKP